MLEELYSNAFCYVLPSDLEGMPLSLLEALSYGNCCVVSDIQECLEVVGEKGVVFRKSDVRDLADKLEWVCKNMKITPEYRKSIAEYARSRLSCKHLFAGGLPGKYAPAYGGALIGERILSLIKQGMV